MENINQVDAIAPALEKQVQVEGTLDSPVGNISFNHSTWIRPSENSYF